MRRASHTINNVKGTGGGLAHNKHMYARLQLMYNITHNSVSAEELGMVVGEGRNRANHSFKFRTIGLGAVTAQLHGPFVARTVPEWNRLPAAAADAASPTIGCSTGQLLARQTRQDIGLWSAFCHTTGFIY